MGDCKSDMKSSLSEKELIDKIKGVIYGAAIGDGVGLATEFMNKREARILYGNGPIKFGECKGHPFWRNAFRSRWFENDFTDDTDQMLLILQCLLSDNGILNPIHFAFRVQEWCKIGFPELDNKMPRGIGFTVGSTCAHPDYLSNPHRAAYDVWNTKDRKLAANGAVMRTSVIGVPFFWNEKIVVENSLMAAKTTHADPRSVTSAVIVSVIISRLLLGSISSTEADDPDFISYFTNMIQFGSTDDDSYLRKFKNFLVPSPKQTHVPAPGRQSLWQRVRVVASRIVRQSPTPEISRNTLEIPFNIPKYEEPDNKRLENPAPLRENVKLIDEYGSDETMMNVCKDVVDKYKFLVQNHPLCPKEADNLHTKRAETGSEIEPSWEQQLYSHCFPDSIASLKLDEPSKIGYAYKCLGAGLYLGTRKKPEGMTSAVFFENLITQLTLEAGDADTNCAVAGAILGCRLGKSGLPQGWVAGIRHKAFLETISDNLCTLALSAMKSDV